VFPTAMLHLMRLSILGLLALPIVSCDWMSRYLAGQGDPDDYSWEQYAVAPLKPRVIGVEGANEEGRRGTLPGALPPAEIPEPAPAATPQKSWPDDLKDCMAPSMKAGTAPADTSTDAPTINRSEDSPEVAACMSDKGYRKVYRQWTF
jgi:hypothetical protein